MGVVPLVVKGGVPFQMGGWDLQPLGQHTSLGAEQGPPAGSGIEAQALGVLPAQGVDGCPDIPPVSVQLFCHLREHHRLPSAGEQAMAALFFHSGAGGHVLHIPLHPGGLHPFPGGDVLGVTTPGAGLVVFQVAEFCDELCHILFFLLAMLLRKQNSGRWHQSSLCQLRAPSKDNIPLVLLIS